MPTRSFLSAASLVVAALALAGAGCRENPGAPAGDAAHAYDDPRLLAALQPADAVESAHLAQGDDGSVTFAARLSGDPPRDYRETYGRLLAARGVFVTRLVQGRFIASAQGHEFRFVRRVRERALAFESRTFKDWSPLHEPGLWGRLGYITPVLLEGRRLTVRLGAPREPAWRLVDFAPDRDVIQLKELPVPRFPGARLYHDPLESLAAREDEAVVLRRYFAPGASLPDVVAHYERAWREQGVPLARTGAGGLSLRPAPTKPIRGLTAIGIGADDPQVFRPSGVGLRELTWSAPALLSGAPAGVYYKATLVFAEAREAQPYLEDLEASRKVGLARSGAWEPVDSLLQGLGRTPGAARLFRPGRYAALVLAPGALDDCYARGALHKALDAYLQEGGRLVVLQQSSGRTYECLPRPEGQPLEAVGALEDGSDYAGSVYSEATHPLLRSRQPGIFSANVDGHFEALPEGARVVLRLTRSSLPCLAYYRHGKGVVVLTTVLDGAGRVGDKGPGTPGLLRDLVDWLLADGPLQEPA